MCDRPLFDFKGDINGDIKQVESSSATFYLHLLMWNIENPIERCYVIGTEICVHFQAEQREYFLVKLLQRKVYIVLRYRFMKRWRCFLDFRRLYLLRSKLYLLTLISFQYAGEHRYIVGCILKRSFIRFFHFCKPLGVTAIGCLLSIRA